MFKFIDFVNRQAMYYPQEYTGFQELPEDYDATKPPFPGAEPTNWAINLPGTFMNAKSC